MREGDPSLAIASTVRQVNPSVVKIPQLQARLSLVMLGLVWGLVVPLSGIAASFGAGPLGLTAWVATIGAVLNLVVAISRGTITSLTLKSGLFFFVWAVVGTVIPQTLLFWVAGRMASSTISIVILLEAFIVFALAALFRLEAPTLRRFVGLAVGFAGMIPILGGATSLDGASYSLTIIAVLGLPICYATENVWISWCKPAEIDPIAGLALMQAIGAALAFGLAIAFDDLFWPGLRFGQMEIILLLLGICSAFANYLFQRLIVASGAVFTGQCSYLIALSGVGWSVFLLGEAVSLWIALSLAGIFLGLLLVTPRRSAEDNK